MRGEKHDAKAHLVRLSRSEQAFLEQFMRETGVESPPDAIRIIIKLVRVEYEDAGPGGCLVKVMSKL